MVEIPTFVPFLSLSKSVKDYSKPFGNCSSVASSSVAEDWADGAPPVAMLEDLATTQNDSLWFQARDSVQNSWSKEGRVGLPRSQPQSILQSFIRWSSATRTILTERYPFQPYLYLAHVHPRRKSFCRFHAVPNKWTDTAIRCILIFKDL